MIIYPAYVFFYKLYNVESGEAYYGSTIDIEDRYKSHRCIKGNNCKSRELVEKYGANNLRFEVKLELLVISEDEKDEIEESYIQNNPCINYKKNLTKESKNKHKKELDKLYYENHKEKITSYNKRYNTQNKEQIKNKQKKYYERNKKLISEKNNKKNQCDCGFSYTHSNYARHLKTKKHQDYLKVKENINVI
jgi:hypothetical protein